MDKLPVLRTSLYETPFLNRDIPSEAADLLSLICIYVFT